MYIYIYIYSILKYLKILIFRNEESICVRPPLTKCIHFFWVATKCIHMRLFYRPNGLALAAPPYICLCKSIVGRQFCFVFPLNSGVKIHEYISLETQTYSTGTWILIFNIWFFYFWKIHNFFLNCAKKYFHLRNTRTFYKYSTNFSASRSMHWSMRFFWKQVLDASIK